MTSFAYDDLGRRVSRTLPAVNNATVTESWTYDDFGRVATHRDFKGTVTTNTYAGQGAEAGRLTEEAILLGGSLVRAVGEVHLVVSGWGRDDVPA